MALLLKQGASVDVKGQNGATPINLANQDCLQEIAMVLLAAEANWKSLDFEERQCLLCYVLNSGRPDMLDILIGKGVYILFVDNVKTTLQFACARGRVASVQTLLRPLIDTRALSDFDIVLGCAALCRLQSLVQKLINSNLNTYYSHTRYSKADILEELNFGYQCTRADLFALKLLVEVEGNIQAQDDRGKSIATEFYHRFSVEEDPLEISSRRKFLHAWKDAGATYDKYYLH